MELFVNNNGTIVSAEQPVVTARNRSFRYGDALFESIRFTNSQPQFLKEHLQRLFTGMKVLKMQKDNLYSESFFENAILELALKNSITTDGRIRLTVYRNDGGLYTPDNNSTAYLIEITPLNDVGAP